MSTDNSQQSTQKEEKDQPLKRSTYNIYEAFDNPPADASLETTCIHPLQTTMPYSMDLSPKNGSSDTDDREDLNDMMKDLDLSRPPSNSIATRRASAMPYCV